jgi:hypothetical protein
VDLATARRAQLPEGISRNCARPFLIGRELDPSFSRRRAASSGHFPVKRANVMAMLLEHMVYEKTPAFAHG